MIRLPIISKYTISKLNAVIEHFSAIEPISMETRERFSGDFPVDTRYFSNGDHPLVALVKLSGDAKLRYDNEDFDIANGEFVFFNDSVPHSWYFNLANLEIFYYRYVNVDDPAPAFGDYCLDHYF